MAAHKWYRLKNITIKTTESVKYIHATEIRFNDITNYNPLKAFALNAYDAANKADKAFDGNSESWFSSIGSSEAESKKWYIGYEFDTPTSLDAMSLQMRQDLPSGYDRSWQTADIEYSDNGVDWFFYGRIEPKFAYKDLSLKTVNVIRAGVVLGNSKQDDGVASRFVLINDWQTGDFIAKVVPQADGSWSCVVKDIKPLLITHVGADGFKPQADGGIIPVVL